MFRQSSEMMLDTNRILFKNLQRQDVANLLKNDGDFLLRSDSEDCTILSVQRQGEILHFKFTDRQQQYKFDGPSFPTLEALLLYYFNTGKTLMASTGAKLLTPIMNESDRTEWNQKEKMMSESHAPNLPFFHYRIDSIFVEQLLERNGDFVLRFNERGDEIYSLSVRWGGVVEFPVPQEDSDRSEGDKCRRQVCQFVEKFVKSGEQLSSTCEARLIRPIERKPWEVLGSAISIEGLAASPCLGKSSFSSVYAVAVRRANTKDFEVVAAKVIDNDGWSNIPPERRPHYRRFAHKEAKVMCDLIGHPNIVPFRGVFIDTEYPVCLMEYIRGISYKKDLRNKDTPSCLRGMLLGAKDAASAVAFMHEKGYIHRSLGTKTFIIKRPLNKAERPRLVLVGFQTARYVGGDNGYKSTPVVKLPVRWSAPESLLKSIWCKGSDIWSLGVVIWEIFNHGAIPYSDMEGGATVSRIVKFLQAGQRLKAPPEMPDKVAEIMRRCWNLDIFERPSALEIARVLNEAVAESECTHVSDDSPGYN